MEELTLPRFDIGLVISLVVLLGIHNLASLPESYDSTLLFIGSVVGLFPVLISALQSIRKKKISVDLLASIALIASLLTKEWGSAVFINLMLTSARLFDYYTASRARSAIRSILKLRPLTVHIKKGDTIIDTPTSQVVVGDVLIIKSGERIAIDGVVIEGEGTADQSSLTGESLPISKIEGDNVWSGTLLSSGALTIRTEKIGKDTTIEKTIALVENAEQGKARIRTIADTFASWYIAIVLIGACVVYAIFRDTALLLSLLLVACADDIAIAIPMGFLASIGRAARQGVIVKGGEFLEALAKVNTIIVDKTGTLTLGQFVVQSIEPFNTYTEKDILSYITLTATYSQHPISKGIITYAKLRSIRFEKPDKVKEIHGKGVEAYIRDTRILYGNVHFVESSGVIISNVARQRIEKAEHDGLNVSVIGKNNELVGIITSADEMRPEIKSAITALKNNGIKKIVMLTGDNEKVAARIAREVGIDEYHAHMLPEQKLEYVRACVKNTNTVAMVGDGVNDAAALTLSNVGIAMGAIGSDAAIEAADIALMKDDFQKIPETIALGRATMRVVKQNFFIWGSVNLIGLILVSLRIIGPEGASAYNFLTDFIPIMNSMRLFRDVER